MDIIKRKIHNIFKWSYKDCFKAIIGTLLFSIAINLFIVPNHLYNGGILGISQLLRSLIVKLFDFNSSRDISGIINFLLNIPLFFLAYKYISKTFFRRTLVCLLFQTIFLTIIPTPDKPLLDELITCVLIGGIIGNLIDRLLRGYVIDFLSFNIFGYSFPIFNIADSFIVISIVIIAIDSFMKEGKRNVS